MTQPSDSNLKQRPNEQLADILLRGFMKTGAAGIGLGAVWPLFVQSDWPEEI